jgi:pimeloyl-ACP methyl ester carboxylesterase
MSQSPPPLAMPAPCSVRSRDGTTIAYYTLGSGPAVLVVPGALSMASDYVSLAETLAERLTVHVVERRGRGQSGPQGAAYGIAMECEDVAAMLAHTGATSVVGHSFGGLVALEAARASPSIARLAVYEPGVSIGGSIDMSWTAEYERKLGEEKPLEAFIAFIKRMSPQSRRTPAWLLKLILPRVIGRQKLDRMYQLLAANLREHREVERLDGSFAHYAQVSARTLIMVGGRSPTWARSTCRQLAGVMPAASLREFPRLDHFGITEGAPLVVGRALTEFLLEPSEARVMTAQLAAGSP